MSKKEVVTFSADVGLKREFKMAVMKAGDQDMSKVINDFMKKYVARVNKIEK